MGESKFAVEGTALAVTLFGTGTVSANGARWEVDESGNINVASAKCWDCYNRVRKIFGRSAPGPDLFLVIEGVTVFYMPSPRSSAR